MIPDELEAFIAPHLDAIMEHCDSVRIFVCLRNAAEGTDATLTLGRGNFYTQYGQVKEWIVKTERIIELEIDHPQP